VDLIGFGELRKISVHWQVDVSQVERVYVTDWMLKGIFDHATLSQSLVLRGGSALRYAYSSEFPFADDPEFFMTRVEDDSAMHDALTAALTAAANASGLKFTITSFSRGAGKVEYTGPLGRRSAAQPRVTLSIVPGHPRLEPARLPLLHPFNESCVAAIAAIALDELVGEQIASLVHTPRVRNVFDLWFAFMKLRDRLNVSQMNTSRNTLLRRKQSSTSADAVFDPQHRAILERSWDNALHEVRRHPSFTQVEHDLMEAFKFVLAN
jgi:predicted nucleotidyltransferase component of viral defense system